MSGVNLWEIAGVSPMDADRLTKQDLRAILAYHNDARGKAADG